MLEISLKTKKLLCVITALTILSYSFGSQSQASISLTDSVDAAMEKQKHLFVNGTNLYISPQFLGGLIDGSPTLSAAYLKSSESFGADEMELSLQLPIKSQYRREVEGLLKNQRQSQKINEQQHRLIMSGLLREIVWEYQLETARIKKAEQKLTLISSLENISKVLSESRALPQYIVLLLSKESTDSQILVLDHKHKAQTLLSQYKILTGLSELPRAKTEKLLTSTPSILMQHPHIVALELSWQNTLAQFKSTHTNTQPWQLQVTAKKVDSTGLSDNQIGLGISVPISLGSNYTPSQQSEFLRAKNEFEFAQHTLFTSLHQNVNQALKRLSFLQQKQDLLDASESLLNELNVSINGMLQANISNKETLIRNALEVIDAQIEIEINRIEVSKQISAIKQASGQTL